MTAVEDRPLRADAARNVERILRAARDVYSELGADAPLEAVARRAGVGREDGGREAPPGPGHPGVGRWSAVERPGGAGSGVTPARTGRPVSA